MLKGIDISNNNLEYLSSRKFYDLQTADFVILKASEGATYRDPLREKYISLIPDNVLIGFYHYARPENANSFMTEANNFLTSISFYNRPAVYAVDVEGDALRCSQEYLDAWVYLYTKYIYEHTGIRPLIYCSASATKRFPLSAKNDMGLWVASWGKQVTKSDIAPWDFAALRQYSNSSGHLDRDYFYGTKETWLAYAGVR